MDASQEKSVLPVAFAIGPCIAGTSPNSHDQPATSPAMRATIAAQLTSPYTDSSGAS
jgi:hypothetical protein